MNPYEVLEIAVGATPDEIKAAYHSMAKKWHPDRYAGEAKAEAERRFRLVSEAYGVLKDSVRNEERPAPIAAPAPAPAPAPAIQLETAPPPAQAQPLTPEEWFKEAKAAVGVKAPEKALGLVQYAIRLDANHAEYHALLGKLLDELGGDKRAQVRALETAIRLDPKDVESVILLARTCQALGMHARATRLWTDAREMAPGHPLFAPPPKAAAGKDAKGKAATAEKPSMKEQWNDLMATLQLAIQRLFKRG
jgi:tetratricopeptide (TPR) repeat protein